MFLGEADRLDKGLILNVRCNAVGRSIARRLFPFFAFLLLIVSMSFALVMDLTPPDKNAADDTRNIVIDLATGTPPRFNQTFPGWGPTIYVTKGLPATFNITVYDADNDPIHVEWSWGDGSLNSTNDTAPAFESQVVSQTHTWNPYSEQGTGNYYIASGRLNVTITDGNGNYVTVSRAVQVLIPDNQSPDINILGPSTTMDPLDNVTIFANASDPEGEPLTWTFVFNDSISDFMTIVNYTGWTAPNELVWNNISYIFGFEGFYTVTMYVSDALPPNQTGFHNLSLSVSVRVLWNVAQVTSDEIAADPIEPVIESAKGYVLVNYSIEAYDLDGDILTATWDFGDGGPGAVNVSNGTTAKYLFTQWINYTETGHHSISVIVTDGRSNHTVTLYRNLTVTSTNLPPSVVGVQFQYPTGSYAKPNETLTFTYVFKDPERDTIMVMVNYSDGTIEFFNVTEYDEEGNATLTFTHVFTDTGTKKIEVMYTDNKVGLYEHILYQNLSVEVKIPPPVIVKRWSWWDYTSLTLVAMIPVLIALRFITVNAKRRRLEDQGLSLEEWKLIKSEQQAKKVKGDKGK